MNCNRCVDVGDIAKKAGDKKKFAKYAVDSSKIADGTVTSQDLAESAGAVNCGLKSNIGPFGIPLVVRNSVFSGPDAACIENAVDEANFVSTQLDGGTSTSSLGTLACVGSYGQNYLALMPDCS